MTTLIIDNYDSFTYNLAHLLKELGAEVTVVHNDRFRLADVEAFDKLVLSPGPGIPREAGQLLEVIRTYAGRKPMLGICLGEQAIGEAFGAKLTNLAEVYHGVQSDTRVTRPDYLFDGLPATFPAGRYHSWVVSPAGLPDVLEVTALSPEGHIMALRHRSLDIRGLQFHPESVLTPQGRHILHNFLKH